MRDRSLNIKGMRKWVLLTAMMFSVVVNAQIKSDRVDEFTGERIMVTERVRIIDGKWYTLTVALADKGGKDYLECNFWANRAFSLENGKTVLYLKFDDGTVGKAVCMDDEVARRSGVQIRERHAEFLCVPDSDLINKMSKNLVVKFRFTPTSGDLEYDVKERRARQLQEQAIAFLSKK